MAFPGDYTKYQEITIDSGQVDADLTDFPIYVDLSDLAKAGSDIFDTCRTDGGDIRVTKSDGTTELAREVVSIDTSGQTGELHVKYTGTLSASSDTTIRIWYNGTDTEPATTATYGRNNVWSDYLVVYHFNQDPSSASATDSTGNGNDAATGGSMTSGDLVDGGVGKAWTFDGSDDYADVGSPGDLIDTTFTYLLRTSDTLRNWALGGRDTDNQPRVDVSINSGAARAQDEDKIWFNISDDSANERRYYTTNDIAAINDGSFHHHAVTFNSAAAIGFVFDGTSQTMTAESTGTVGAVSYSTRSLYLGGFNNGSLLGPSAVDFSCFRIRNGTLATTWSSTEYNNLLSPGTFYTTGDEVDTGGGGATFVPKVIFF